jgi:dihydroflavonol-4-reductase
VPRPLPSHALVTGGAGFVGHAVVAALVRAGVAVRVLDPASPHPRWPAGVEHVRGGVSDDLVLREAARDVDAIFHVAGVWDGRPGGEQRMEALNVGGTRAVLALGLPVVYTSSSITCGFGTTRPGTEDEPSEDPRHPMRGTPRAYHRTKLAAEALVAAAGGFLVNPDYVVGPGDRGGVVTGPLLRAARLPVIPVPPGGKCFVGVNDVGEGHLLAWRFGVPGRRYLLGAENRTYADVIGTIARLRGHPRPVVPLPPVVARVLRHVPRLGPTAGALEQMALLRYRSGERARTELEWRPRPVDEALAAMVAAERTDVRRP